MTFDGVTTINSFLRGDTEGTYKYNSICALLSTFDQWSDDSKLKFIDVFYETYHLLGYECFKFVEGLCNIRWELIPDKKYRKLYAEFLTLIAIHNVFHVRNIFNSMFSKLSANPLLHISQESSDEINMNIDDKDIEIKKALQDEIYNLVIDSVLKIVNSNKNYRKFFLSAVDDRFPLIKMPEFIFMSYFKNLIILADKFADLAQDLWLIIISRMLQLDAVISRSTRRNENNLTINNPSLTTLNGNNGMIMPEKLTKEMEIEFTQKLDKTMTIVLARITKGKNCFNFDETKWMSVLDMETNMDILFEHLWPAFLELTLPAYDIQSVSFIWFYMCSFEQKYLNTVLRILWNLVEVPSLAPNEWKRSQNAATFIGGFLARANYVDFDRAFRWMQKMANWCNEYINVAGLRKSVEGCLQHGTFYAVVQALLFVFTYRYREFVENNRVHDVHHWGLQRIIHSQFQPLRFISRVIALGFATISRQLQIVYCSHIIEETPEKSPIEHYLPFSVFQLPVASSIVMPFIRKFESADDSIDHISIDFSDDTNHLDTSGDDEFDFMNDDESVERNQKYNIAAVLSTSPYSAFASTATKANFITHH